MLVFIAAKCPRPISHSPHIFTLRRGGAPHFPRNEPIMRSWPVVPAHYMILARRPLASHIDPSSPLPLTPSHQALQRHPHRGEERRGSHDVPVRQGGSQGRVVEGRQAREGQYHGSGRERGGADAGELLGSGQEGVAGGDDARMRWICAPYRTGRMVVVDVIDRTSDLHDDVSVCIRLLHCPARACASFRPARVSCFVAGVTAHAVQQQQWGG